MPSYTAQAIINTALTNLGILEQGGTPGSSDSTAALNILNLMLEQWRLQDRFIWSVSQGTYALTALTAMYSIGPSGTAPFNVARPEYIESANITIAGPTAANLIVWPLRLIGEPEYAAIRDPKATASIPRLLYNDRGSPNSNLYLWPTPRAATTTNLVLYTWAQLSSYAGLLTSNDLPEGYAEAIIGGLAYRLLPSYGASVAAQLAQAVTGIALQSEAKITDLNTRARGLAPQQPAGATK